MDCNKRRYSLEAVVEKIESGKELEHCEELFYLMHHHHLSKEDAEKLLYRSEHRIKSAPDNKGYSHK